MLSVPFNPPTSAVGWSRWKRFDPVWQRALVTGTQRGTDPVAAVTEMFARATTVVEATGGRNPFDPRRETPLQEIVDVAVAAHFDYWEYVNSELKSAAVEEVFNRAGVDRRRWESELNNVVGHLRADCERVMDPQLDDFCRLAQRHQIGGPFYNPRYADPGFVRVEHRPSGLRVEMAANSKSMLKIDSRPENFTVCENGVSADRAHRYRGLGIGQRVYLEAYALFDEECRAPALALRPDALPLRAALHRKVDPYIWAAPTTAPGSSCGPWDCPICTSHGGAEWWAASNRAAVAAAHP